MYEGVDHVLGEQLDDHSEQVDTAGQSEGQVDDHQVSPPGAEGHRGLNGQGQAEEAGQGVGRLEALQ